LDWDERAFDVNDAIEPSVWNFKSKKVGAWLQYPMSFCEGTILLFARPQMMQDEYRNGRGESSVGKGQGCCVALHDAGATSVLSRYFDGKKMVVLKTDDATGAFSQFRGGGACPRADFQNVIAHIGAA